MFCSVFHIICVIRVFSCPRYRFVGDLSQITYSFFISHVFPKPIFFSTHNRADTVWGIIQKKKEKMNKIRALLYRMLVNQLNAK